MSRRRPSIPAIEKIAFAHAQRAPTEQASKGSHIGLSTLGHLLLRNKLDKGAERGDAKDVGNAFSCCTLTPDLLDIGDESQAGFSCIAFVARDQRNK